ncbi:MAG: aminotransferase class I/II-fold pyridoxal phosphate-dependent enzyme [Pseudomonadota bacterium]
MLTLDRNYLDAIPALLKRMGQTGEPLPQLPDSAPDAALMAVLETVAERLRDNFPYPHPLYAGQMLKPPHPVARLAYTLALWINPNNHALDGGRASSALEKEAVAALAAMVGWQDGFLGHLTSGGTVANLEALYVAGQLVPGKRIVASTESHYTHERLCGVLKLPFAAISTNENGAMDITALERELAGGDVGTVVVTLGTTGLGAIDPLDAVLALRARYDFRVHVDAAYGGYFTLAADALTGVAQNAYAYLAEVDSIVIDPHKHGLQPYGCGSVLFRDASVAQYYAHGSPYTYFSSDDLHLGEISLECSRAGASAVALWATQQLLPMRRDGSFADGLRASINAARLLHDRLSRDAHSSPLLEPALDIVVWAPLAATATAVSRLSQAIFEETAALGLHLATLRVSAETAARRWPSIEMDAPEITCLRSVLMKPEHETWLDTIWERYCQGATLARQKGQQQGWLP